MRSKYAALIRQCENAAEGRQIHRQLRSGADSIDLTNLLIQMYTRCGCPEESLETFHCAQSRDQFTWNTALLAASRLKHIAIATNLLHRMPEWDSISWNTLLSAQAHESPHSVLHHFQQMPPIRTILSWNALLAAFARGSDDPDQILAIFHLIPLHHIISATLLLNSFRRLQLTDLAVHLFRSIQYRDPVLWNSFLQVIPAVEALQVFHRFPMHGDVSCNTVIALLAGTDLSSALEIFQQMQWRDLISWNTLLNAFAVQRHLQAAQRVFNVMPHSDAFSFTSMMALLSSSSTMSRARELFDRTPEPSLPSWNAMLTGYAAAGDFSNASELFRLLDLEGFRPDDATWLAMLDACSGKKSFEQTIELRSLILAELSSLSMKSLLLANGLLRMYTKSQELDLARAAFDSMHSRDVISWNTMLAGIAETSDRDQVLLWFDRMPQHDAVSWNTTAGIRTDPESIPERNAGTWNTLVTASARRGDLLEALSLLLKMDMEGFKPSSGTLAAMLFTGAESDSIAAMITEELTHLGKEKLVNVYGSTGGVLEAKRAFDSDSASNSSPGTSSSWNSLISAYSRNGRRREAIAAYNLMELDGVEADVETKTLLLSACSHEGDLDNVLYFFKMLPGKPRKEHYVCMIDTLARCGLLDSAWHIASELGPELPQPAWTSILSASSNL